MSTKTKIENKDGLYFITFTALIGFKNSQNKSFDSIIGNGKRFMAYEIKIDKKH